MSMGTDVDRSSGIELTCRLTEERFRQVEMAALMRRFYTADARYITPEHRVLQGRDEIGAYIQSVGDAVQAVGLRLETLVARPCGPGRAYVIGNGTLVLANGEQLGSHYLCVFREEGGEWLCETEMAGMDRLDLTPAA